MMLLELGFKKKKRFEKKTTGSICTLMSSWTSYFGGGVCGSLLHFEVFGLWSGTKA